MKIIITAGPTREYLDPVRFLSNPSTGKMGFALASEAVKRGHKVVLVAGPVTLKTPAKVNRVDVTSAREMLEAVKSEIIKAKVKTEGAKPKTVVLISTAAVADWRPAKCAKKKLKKGEISSILKLVRNPDILKTINRNRSTFGYQPLDLKLVGFAAETNNVLKEAKRKCREKGLSFIVANDVSEKGSGFGTDTNRVTLVFPNGLLKNFPLMTKRRVAIEILKELEK